MPRVDIPVTTITRAGVAPPTETTGVPADGHSVAGNDGKVFLEVRNSGSTVTRTATVLFANTVDGVTVPGKACAVLLSSTKHFGPWPVALYGTTLLVDVDNAELRLRAWRRRARGSTFFAMSAPPRSWSRFGFSRRLVRPCCR